MSKTLGNLGEAMILALTVPVAALVRVIVANRVPEKAFSLGLVGVLCFVALCVFWWTPPLPE
jgi:hypothetical protein